MNINNHKFIILGSYTANVLGQARGLGEQGLYPYGVLIQKNTFRIDKSKYWAKVYSVDTIEEGLELVLNVFGKEKQKPFLYTDRDDVMGMLDKRYNELKEKFYFWNAGEQGRLGKFLNKMYQISIAKECGILTPKTELVKVGELPTQLKYPIFTKSTDSLNIYWKGNAHICHNEDELRRVYKTMDVEHILLQEYIEKEEELPIEGISLNGGEEIKLLGRTKYYRMPKDSFGTYRYVTPYENQDLEKKIKLFIRRINYTGPFEIEFIINNQGTAFYLETNFRIAQQNYGFVKLGANIPYLYAKSVLQEHIVEKDINYIAKGKINIMHEFEDFKYSIIKKNVSFIQWIKDVYNSDCFSFYNKNDILPFVYTLFSKCANVIIKITH